MSSSSSSHWVDALTRPQVGRFEPYLPGRSLESVRRERGLKRLVKLASNENPLGPSARALRSIAQAGKTFFRYPDGASTALREALAKKSSVSPRQVIIGAGSDELIELLGKTFLNPSDSIVVSDHAFIRYRMAGELMGAQVITVPMRNWAHDLEAMGRALQPNTKLLFVANPNNPTGTYNTARELESLLIYVTEQNAQRATPVLVVVDEAYEDYARVLAKDYPKTLVALKRYPNLVILRTFSKIHALAGLRVGYGVADPEVIAALDRVRPPFNVSTAAQVAAQAALSDAAQIRRGIALVREGQKAILPMLRSWGLPVIPSIGNFFMMDMSPRSGAAVFEALLARGVIVRAMDEYGFPRHLRVTYGLPAENKFFLKALREVLAR